MNKTIVICVVLAATALATTSSIAADYHGKYPSAGVSVDVDQG